MNDRLQAIIKDYASILNSDGNVDDEELKQWVLLDEEIENRSDQNIKKIISEIRKHTMTKKQLTQFLISLGLKQDKAEKLANQIPDGLKDLPDDDLKEALEEIVSYNNDLFKNTDDYKNALKSKHDQAMREVLTKTEKKRN